MAADWAMDERAEGKVLIGLDVGGSITKIIGFRGETLLGEVRVQASDPVASAYGALGKFLTLNRLTLDRVDSIHATGVGASYLDEKLLECKTVIVPEFEAVGIGGLYTAGLDRAIVVSMGTGTSIVYAHGRTIRHIIGSGVGGGTLLGLGKVILNIRDFQNIEEMAARGKLDQVDLSIGDISRHEIPGLPAATTASNFGKVGDHARPEDLALAIVNLVFQSVGTSAVLAARLEEVDKIVVTGNLLRVSKGREVLEGFSRLYSIEIVVPDKAEYATAIGAALYRAHE